MSVATRIGTCAATTLLAAVGGCTVRGDMGDAVCQSGSCDDSGSPDVAVSNDAMTSDGGLNLPDATGEAGASTKFFLMVTESPKGPTIAQELWGGVLRFDIAANGAPATPGTGIDKSLVADPDTLAFRKRSAELFVGNRHGNLAPGGIAGSISRFLYSASNESFTPNGTITGNGLEGVTALAFSPEEDTLYASNVFQNTISRFQFDSQGNVSADSSIGVADDAGWTIGLAVAPDGKRLYLTTGSFGNAVIRQFDLTNNAAELPALSVPYPACAPPAKCASGLGYITIVGKTDLYVGGYYDPGGIYHFTIDANDDLTLVDTIADPNPLGVAFSPDGLEMFAANHEYSYFIDRFQLLGNTWAQETSADGAFAQILTPSALGGILVFPASAVPIIK